MPAASFLGVVGKNGSGKSLLLKAIARQLPIARAQVLIDGVDVNQIDPATGTTKLKAVFPNTDESLFPNQFVNVRVLLDVKKDAVIVPGAAVQRGKDGTFVYVVKAVSQLRPLVFWIVTPPLRQKLWIKAKLICISCLSWCLRLNY